MAEEAGDLLLKAAQDVWRDREKNPPIFAFKVGQSVRIRVKLDDYWPDEDKWKGQIGTVVKRYEAGTFTRKGNWYHIKLGNEIEPFKESELDLRYRSTGE